MALNGNRGKQKTPRRAAQKAPKIKMA
jgi:hypothetical protein